MPDDPSDHHLPLPAHLYERLRDLAEQEGTSVESLVMLALANYVTDRESSVPPPPPSRPRVTLRAGKVAHVLSRARTVIGRGAGADLVLTGGALADEHAALEIADGDVTLVALANQSVRVNGAEAKRKVLADGDVVQIGEHALEVRLR